MRKNTGFTLIEILVAVTLTGMILLTGYSAFQQIIQAQGRLGAAIDVQKNLFYTNEKLAALIRDGGTIDYEEYFNRSILGYVQAKRTVDGVFTFTNYSHFGNGNDEGTGQTPIYYCGFAPPQADADMCLSTTTPVYVNTDKNAATFSTPYPIDVQQAYGQYSALALNYDDPVGYPVPIKLPPIFTASDTVSIATRDVNGDITFAPNTVTDVGLPELYLIKKNLDNSYTRTYFRHVYAQDSFPGSTICNPTISLEGCLGKIQMTQLESCDSIGGVDGIIEAWIPAVDFRVGNVTCPTLTENIFMAAHEGVLLPSITSANLTWVDLTAPDMNVIRATFLPSPLKIPALMAGAEDTAQSPRVSVYLEVQLSTLLRNKSFVRTNMNYPRTLITTYDLSE